MTRRLVGGATVAAGLAFLTSATLALTGCTATAFTSPAASATPTAPRIEGPWAAEFTAEWQAATTDVERRILEDGVVTDQEYSEMTERFRACLADAGIEFGGFEPDGSYETTSTPGADQDAAHETVNDCSRTSGEDSVGLLYSWVNRNPEHLDDNAIVVQCLQDSGVVDRGYTAAEYSQDIELESYPFIVDVRTGLAAVEVCESDPLGLLGMQDR